MSLLEERNTECQNENHQAAKIFNDALAQSKNQLTYSFLLKPYDTTVRKFWMLNEKKFTIIPLPSNQKCQKMCEIKYKIVKNTSMR